MGELYSLFLNSYVLHCLFNRPCDTGPSALVGRIVPQWRIMMAGNTASSPTQIFYTN